MSFLKHWQNQPKEAIQGNLLPSQGEKGDAIVDSTEPTRLTAYRKLHDTLKERGAMELTHRAVNQLQNIEILGEDFEALYEELGLTTGDRAKLPIEAKQALMVGDIAAFEQIMQDNAEGHYALIESSHKGFKQARKLFRWSR